MTDISELYAQIEILQNKFASQLKNLRRAADNEARGRNAAETKIASLEAKLKAAEAQKQKLTSEVSVLIKEVKHSQVVIKNNIKPEDTKLDLINAFVSFIDRELKSNAEAEDQSAENFRGLLEAAKVALTTAYSLPEDKAPLEVDRTIEDLFCRAVRNDIKLSPLEDEEEERNKDSEPATKKAKTEAKKHRGNQKAMMDAARLI